MLLYHNVGADTSLKAATTPQFYQDGAPTQRGGSAVAVPGDLKGLKALHERFGQLPWKDVVQPSIDLARNGFDFFPDLYEVSQEHTYTVTGSCLT